MKILQIINNLGSGGAEKLISDFAPLMHHRGHEVEVLLLQRKGSIYIDVLENNGLKVTCLSEGSLYSPVHIFRIWNFIKRGRFNIINVHIFPALYWVGLASLFGTGSSKMIYTEHSTNNNRRNNKFLKYIDRFIYNRYSKLIAITEQVKKAIDKHLNIFSDFSVVINNGVDISKFKEAQALNKSSLYENYKKGDVILCMVGRFSEAKDQSTLIKAIQKLPDNFHLLLIGEGPLREKSVSLVNNLKIRDRVHFLGLRIDVPEILKACDVGVLSSNWEGMPISALEIFASGIPFIGTRVPGIKDLFEGYESSTLLYTHKNHEELASKIIALLDKDKLRNIQISQAIVSQFSLDHMVDGYLKLYEEVKN